MHLQSATLYYKVRLPCHSGLQSIAQYLCPTKCYSGDTLYYKVLLQHNKVLLQHYKVLLQHYKALLQHYSEYCRVLLQYCPSIAGAPGTPAIDCRGVGHPGNRLPGSIAGVPGAPAIEPLRWPPARAQTTEHSTWTHWGLNPGPPAC